MMICEKCKTEYESEKCPVCEKRKKERKRTVIWISVIAVLAVGIGFLSVYLVSNAMIRTVDSLSAAFYETFDSSHLRDFFLLDRKTGILDIISDMKKDGGTLGVNANVAGKEFKIDAVISEREKNEAFVTIDVVPQNTIYPHRLYMMKKDSDLYIASDYKENNSIRLGTIDETGNTDRIEGLDGIIKVLEGCYFVSDGMQTLDFGKNEELGITEEQVYVCSRFRTVISAESIDGYIKKIFAEKEDGTSPLIKNLFSLKKEEKEEVKVDLSSPVDLAFFLSGNRIVAISAWCDIRMNGEDCSAELFLQLLGEKNPYDHCLICLTLADAEGNGKAYTLSKDNIIFDDGEEEYIFYSKRPLLNGETDVSELDGYFYLDTFIAKDDRISVIYSKGTSSVLDRYIMLSGEISEIAKSDFVTFKMTNCYSEKDGESAKEFTFMAKINHPGSKKDYEDISEGAFDFEKGSLLAKADALARFGVVHYAQNMSELFKIDLSVIK